MFMSMLLLFIKLYIWHFLVVRLVFMINHVVAEYVLSSFQSNLQTADSGSTHIIWNHMAWVYDMVNVLLLFIIMTPFAKFSIQIQIDRKSYNKLVLIVKDLWYVLKYKCFLRGSL